MFNFESGKLAWLKAIFILLIEVAVGYFIFASYPLVSMLFLGEGGDSLLYSNVNEIIWALSPIIIGTIINSFKISKGLKANAKNTVRYYITIQSALLILYIVFITIYWERTNGFHI